MGKNNLILGTARGKLGDVVFYRTGGEQRFRTRVRPTNPRTDAQLLQRCVVATAVKFYSLYAMVGDHAFQNFEGSLKNHQRFMKLNIDYLRKIALQNVKRWSPIEFKPTNVGNFTWKDSPLVAINNYQLSEGDLPSVPVTVQSQYDLNSYIGVPMNMATTPTYQEVCDMLGINFGDQLTFVVVWADDVTGYANGCKIGRVVFAPATGGADTPFFTSAGQINSPNAENYGDVTLTKSDEQTEDSPKKNWLKITVNGTADDYLMGIGVITSRFEGNAWRRSTSFLATTEIIDNIATLQSAMASYLKSDTSSLYLNQSNDGDIDTRTKELEIQSRSVEEVEIEEEPKKKRKAKSEE